MTPCHAYVCRHLCFGLCDRTQRKLRSTKMLTRVRRAARRSRHQARRLRVCARLLGTSMRCVCVYIARMVCHGASQKSGLSQPRARANIACDIRNEHAARTPTPRLGGQHAFSACRRASSPTWSDSTNGASPPSRRSFFSPSSSHLSSFLLRLL